MQSLNKPVESAIVCKVAVSIKCPNPHCKLTITEGRRYNESKA